MTLGHVGLNCVFLVPGATGGTETAVRNLIPALRAAAPAVRFTAFVGVDAAAEDLGVDQVVVRARARHRAAWVAGEQLLLPGAVRAAGCQLVHSLAGTAPVAGRFTRVVSIHDLQHRTIPAAHGRARATGMRVLVGAAARSADRIITSSRHTRNEIMTRLGITSDTIDVIAHGADGRRAAPTDEAALRARLALGPRPIVMSLAGRRAHKNVHGLLRALARIPHERRPVTVIAGYRVGGDGSDLALARRLEVDHDVRFTGWLPDADIEGLFAAATLLVHASLAEGFGLPVIEAMARGVPVACSAIPALTEVAGGAAVFFSPGEPDSIAAAIQRVLGDDALAERLRRDGATRAARYTWRGAAEATLASYERAASATAR